MVLIKANYHHRLCLAFLHDHVVTTCRLDHRVAHHAGGVGCCGYCLDIDSNPYRRGRMRRTVRTHSPDGDYGYHGYHGYLADGTDGAGVGADVGVGGHFHARPHRSEHHRRSPHPRRLHQHIAQRPTLR